MHAISDEMRRDLGIMFVRISEKRSVAPADLAAMSGLHRATCRQWLCEMERSGRAIKTGREMWRKQ